jgi:exosortase
MLTNIKDNRTGPYAITKEDLCCIFMILALVFVYKTPFATLVGHWWSNSLYTHGFIIPLISLYIAHFKRDELSAITPAPSYLLGSILLITSISLLFAGKITNTISLQEVTIIPMIAGIIALLFGKAFLKKLYLPIVYLIFAIPIWENLFDKLYTPFQLISAKMSAVLIQFVGIPVYRDGVFLQLPHITLEVARECSGIGYLLSVIAISLPLASIFLDGYIRKGTLIISSVIIAFLSNGLRIVLIAILSYYGFSSVLHGPFHILQGLFVAFAGYIVIFIGLMILSKKKKDVKTEPSVEKCDVDNRSRAELLRGTVPNALMLGVLFILVGLVINYHTASSVQLNQPLSSLTTTIDVWSGRKTAPTITEFMGLGADHELHRVYTGPDSQKVELYIGHFESQYGTKEMIQYKTKKLHLDSKRIQITTPGGSTIEVNMLQETSNRVMLFFYIIDGNVVPGRYGAKLQLLKQYATSLKTNGSIVAIAVNGQPENISYSEEFLIKLYPELSTYLMQ